MKNEYMGEIIHNWKENYFNKYVITGMIQGSEPEKRIGRLIQVRLEVGDFGSDAVFLRHSDGSLSVHTNQCFFLIPDEYIKEIEFDFESEDTIDTEYTQGHENPEIGFIIPSPIKDGESTPMRDIKNALYNRISDYIEREI